MAPLNPTPPQQENSTQPTPKPPEMDKEAITLKIQQALNSGNYMISRHIV